jgi:hypothetical protein
VPPVPTSHAHYRSVRLRGIVLPPKVLQVDTYCLRTGDRCMSLGHAGPEVVTLMFADDKWPVTNGAPREARARRRRLQDRFERTGD